MSLQNSLKFNEYKEDSEYGIIINQSSVCLSEDKKSTNDANEYKCKEDIVGKEQSHHELGDEEAKRKLMYENEVYERKNAALNLYDDYQEGSFTKKHKKTSQKPLKDISSSRSLTYSEDELESHQLYQGISKVEKNERNLNSSLSNEENESNSSKKYYEKNAALNLIDDSLNGKYKKRSQESYIDISIIQSMNGLNKNIKEPSGFRQQIEKYEVPFAECIKKPFSEDFIFENSKFETTQRPKDTDCELSYMQRLKGSNESTTFVTLRLNFPNIFILYSDFKDHISLNTSFFGKLCMCIQSSKSIFKKFLLKDQHSCFGNKLTMYYIKDQFAERPFREILDIDNLKVERFHKQMYSACSLYLLHFYLTNYQLLSLKLTSLTPDGFLSMLIRTTRVSVAVILSSKPSLDFSNPEVVFESLFRVFCINFNRESALLENYNTAKINELFLNLEYEEAMLVGT